MKVTDLHPKLNLYRKTAAAEQSSPKEGKAFLTGKLDVAGFAHGATVADKAMIGTKAGIHSYLAAPADGDRIEALRAGVKEGTYRVETDDIVDAILGFERTI